MNIRREQTDHAPHECPECGEAAYIGMNNVECTYYKCRHFHEDTWEAHILALPDEGDPPDIEDDEPTQPQGKSLSFDEWLADDDTQALSIPAPSWKRHAELRRIMEEYDRACAELNKAIDTVPVPCYNVGHGSERES